MGQEFGRNIKSFVPSLSDRAAQMNGIPVDDNCGKQVEAGDPVMLPLSGAIANFALATNTQRILERMMGFALVESSGDSSASGRNPTGSHRRCWRSLTKAGAIAGSLVISPSARIRLPISPSAIARAANDVNVQISATRRSDSKDCSGWFPAVRLVDRNEQPAPFPDLRAFDKGGSPLPDARRVDAQRPLCRATITKTSDKCQDIR